MTTGSMAVRVVLGVVGLLLLLGGLGLAALNFAGSFFAALWLIVPGVVLIIVAVIEVSRYRSQAAEQANYAPGPGGGETEPPEPRFRPTDEVFVDPTSKLRMRVYTDPRTGERRYVAEG